MEPQSRRSSPVQLALVADDDDAVRKLIKLTLELAGWSVIEARSGSEALGLARVSQPQIIITDDEMPGFNGADVIAQLRREGLKVRAILVSGHALERFVGQGQGLACLRKPFALQDLLKAAQELVKGDG
jgi:CheY-like chemotaxis protein